MGQYFSPFFFGNNPAHYPHKYIFTLWYFSFCFCFEQTNFIFYLFIIIIRIFFSIGLYLRKNWIRCICSIILTISGTNFLFRYEEQIKERDNQIRKEDLSDMVAEHAAKQKVINHYIIQFISKAIIVQIYTQISFLTWQGLMYVVHVEGRAWTKCRKK